MTVPEEYFEAGRILSEARALGREEISEGVSHNHVATTVEEYIRENGGKPAFPVNISVDNEAAHRTPSSDDKTTFGEEDVVCLDIGVHVDGYPVDSAVTIDLGGNAETEVQAAEAALENAIEKVEAGTSPKSVGNIIHDTFDDYGVEPITNLMGHGLSRWSAHDEPNIPNIRNSTDGGRDLEVGDVIAIEPFVTTGSGAVRPTNTVTIFEASGSGQVRDAAARSVFEEIKSNHSTFPFAGRWLSSSKAREGLQRLVQAGIVEGHPVLIDREGSIVTQAEHTLYVQENGCTVLTREN